MRAILLFIVFPFFLYESAAQSGTPRDWQKWSNKAKTISMSYPKDWIRWDFKMGEIVSFVTSKSDAKDNFPDGIVLIARPNTGNLALDALNHRGNRAMSASGSIKIVSSRKLTYNKRAYYKNVLEAIDGKWIQYAYVFIHKGQVYFLQLTIEPRNKKELAWIGDEVFKTLELK